ncbi:MAG TPA: glycosyltransferase family 2 protein, partial [Gaiellaceae bacterium]|nr:glycosyltransferase family 2 protein [Gaiellaceae bacterium]
DRWRDSLFADGWLDPDFDPEAGPPFRRSGPRATLWVPDTASRRAELLLDSWSEVELAGEPFDVVNNVGTLLLPGGHAADRGYLQRDEGQFETPEEIFAWSGTSVLLRRAYLDDVGLFDPRLFAYYEDVDLSWRGRARGWRYLYVPGSIVRHAHAATAVVGSELFDYHVERNRLLVHAKNAPASHALAAVGESLRVTGLHVRRDLLRPLLRREPPTTTFMKRRGRALGGFLRELPGTLRERQRLREKLPASEVDRWLSTDGGR